MEKIIFYLIGSCLLVWMGQGEYLPLMPSDHIYEVMPTRKIYKINVQWNCEGWGWSNARECEEGSGTNPKLIRLYRKDMRATTDNDNPVLRETTTIQWDARKEKRKMWINSTFRDNNDFVKQWITVPLDLWDYTYADANSKKTNMSIQLTGSHLQLWYNDYKVVYIWLRDQAEDITYTTHVKLEKNFFFEQPEKAGQIYWYYGDESLWCWVNCTQKHVYNFSGYYDEVLSPRTDSYQIYLNRKDNPITKPAFCTYHNCTRDYENYPRCLMVNYTAYNGTSDQDEELLDLRCVNDTYDLSKEIEAAKIYWKTQNITNLRRNGWNQSVPDDPTGVGIVNGLYKCLQRDYCHDFRPFQLFNFEGSAHILAGNVFLVAGGLILGLLINLEV